MYQLPLPSCSGRGSKLSVSQTKWYSFEGTRLLSLLGCYQMCPYSHHTAAWGTASRIETSSPHPHTIQTCSEHSLECILSTRPKQMEFVCCGGGCWGFSWYVRWWARGYFSRSSQIPLWTSLIALAWIFSPILPSPSSHGCSHCHSLLTLRCLGYTLGWWGVLLYDRTSLDSQDLVPPLLC